MKTILQKFFESKYCKNIFKQFTILAIYIGGSYSVSLQNSESDIDIYVLVDRNVTELEILFYESQKIAINGTIISIRVMSFNQYINPLRFWEKTGLTKAEDIIYIYRNEKFNKTIGFIQNNTDKFINLGISEILADRDIDNIINNNKLTNFNKKHCYSILYGLSKIDNTISKEDISYFKNNNLSAYDSERFINIVKCARKKYHSLITSAPNIKRELLKKYEETMEVKNDN